MRHHQPGQPAQSRDTGTVTISPRRLAMVCCSVTGLILAAPAGWVNLTHQRAQGVLSEVFVIPLGDGRARVSTVYDFTAGNHTWMGWDQDDGWMRPGPDPVLPSAEAEAHAEKLRLVSLNGPQRRTYQVYYQANDPAGTAFISFERGPPWVGLQLGMGCVVLSLFLSLPIALPFMKVPR